MKDQVKYGQILEKINNPQYELYINFLAHILPIVNKINVEFQSSQPKIYLLYERITSLFKTILKYFFKSNYVDSICDVFKINIVNTREYLPNDQIYLGAKVEILIQKNIFNDNNELIKLYNNCLSFYIELCTQIKNRFKNMNIYQTFTLLNPHRLLEKPINFLPLIEQFPNLLSNNIEQVSSQAREICDLGDAIKAKLKEMDFLEFWFELYYMPTPHNFNDLCLFVFNLLSLPHSSASAERIFSQLNLIKNKQRNRLLPETCNALLMAKNLLGNNKCYEWTPEKNLLDKCIWLKDDE